MSKIICDIFMYIFEALLLYNYANELFLSKKKTRFKILSVILINAVLFLIYQSGISILNGIFLFVLYCFEFWYVFNERLSNSIFHALIFISIMAASEFVVIGMCSLLFGDINAMHNDLSAYVFVIGLSKLIYFSIITVFKKMFAVKRKRRINDSFYWVLFLLPLGSIIILVLIHYISNKYVISDFVGALISVVSVILLFENILAFIIYEKAIKNLYELYDLRTVTLQQHIDEKYFDAIEQSQEEIKYFSHDMKNYLLQIRYFESIEEIHQYLDEIIENVEKISYVRISSNKMLNLIISKYSAICEKKRIKFIPEVKLANLKYIEDVDLSTLLNNLLDNAVEAAEATQNGRIELSIFSKNSKFDGIILKNSCATPPKHINNELITSKKDKLLHGLGVNIVKKVLKKYDGIYDWNYNETRKMFETSIVFPKS